MEEQEGYDMANTMFNPEGRLRQLEYASKATKKGSPVIGIVAKDAVYILVYRTVSNDLRIARPEQKIEIISDHIAVGICGIVSDGASLVESSQVEAANHWINTDTPIDVEAIASHVGEILQSYTQFSGMRPFGVTLLIGGIDDNGPSLYVTDASGTYYGYRAMCVGKHDDVIKEHLRKKHVVGCSREEALLVGINGFKEAFGKEFSVDCIQAIEVAADSSTRRLDPKELKNALKKGKK